MRSLSWRMLLPTVMLGLAACEGDNNATTPTAIPADASTPTPTFTPTYTPALDEPYRVDSLLVAPEGEGLDLDGDGEVDNGIYDAMDVLAEGSVDAVTRAVREAVDQGALSQEQGLAVIAAATATLSQALTVDLLNQLTAAALTDTGLALISRIERPLGGTIPTLAFWLGETSAGTPGLVWSAGALTGADWDLAGETSSTFGPGRLELPIAVNNQGVSYQAILRDCQARLTHDPLVVQDGALGAGVDAGLLLLAATPAFEVLEEQLLALGVDFSAAEASAELEDIVSDSADMTCEGDVPCVSVSWTWLATATTLIVDPDGDGDDGVEMDTGGSVTWSGPVVDALAEALAEVLADVFGPLYDALYELFESVVGDIYGAIVDIIYDIIDALLCAFGLCRASPPGSPGGPMYLTPSPPALSALPAPRPDAPAGR